MVKQELWVVGSPAYARAGEGVYWELDTTNYGGLPTAESVTAYDLKTDTDVTSTVLSGSASVNGNVIRLPKFQSDDVGDFKLIISFTNANFAPAKPELDVYVLK